MTFSPSLPASCCRVSPTVEPSSDSAATSPSPFAATSLVMSESSDVNSLPFATKSVLQLSSTMAPTLPSTITSTAPSVASRSLSLPASAMPLARSQSMASSNSPSDSSRACLQSSIPAPVALRNAAMSLAEYSAIRTLLNVGALLDLGGAQVCCGLGRSRLGLGVGRLGLGELRFALALRGRRGVAGLLLRRRLRRLLLGREDLRRRGRRLRGGGIGLDARLGLLARPEPLALDHRVGHDAAHQVGGADGVVVAGDHEVDDVGIAVGVDDGDHGNAEAVGLGDRDVLLLGVDHEDRIGRLLERADAAQVALELGDLALDLEALLLDHLLGLAGADQALELVHLRDAPVDGLEVGEHAAEPAVVDVRGVGPVRLRLDRLLRLLLRPDEEHRAAVLDRVAHEPVGGVDPFQRLLQVDDVDPVALPEDEALHLGVPAPGLVTEVDPGLQQLLHGDDGRCFCHGTSFRSCSRSWRADRVRSPGPMRAAPRLFLRPPATGLPRTTSDCGRA